MSKLTCEKCLTKVNALYPLYDEDNDSLPPKMVCLKCLTTPPDLSTIFRLSAIDELDS